MRFRAGDAEWTSQDSLSVANANNVIVDHVSASWGMDETLSVTLSNNVTVQNSIIAETLNPNGDHSDGSLVRGNVTASTPGGYTFTHNLWISNDIEIPASARVRPAGSTAPQCPVATRSGQQRDVQLGLREPSTRCRATTTCM